MKANIHFTEKLKQLFVDHFKEAVTAVEPIPASGSDRRYIRIIGEKQVAIGAYNPNKKENNTYFYFTGIFERNQLPVPKVYAETNDKECYLLEDVGSECLFDVLSANGQVPATKKLYLQAIEDLVKFQWMGGRHIDYSMCFAAEHFDKHTILSDLNYFKYYFVDLLKLDYNRNDFQAELEKWSGFLASEQPRTFMYRDFQSRNILVKDNKLSYIDFQGGMEGLAQYDLVSLLWQAKAKLSKEWKDDLLNHYIQTVKSTREISNFDEMHFRRVYLEVVLLRILQTLGAYGLRGLIERKPHFLSSIYPALLQLKDYLSTYPHLAKYTTLNNVLTQLVSDKVLAQFNQPIADENSKLKISIYSFSYKKGIPADDSGHGGGYVFDCRGILNPGRFEPYKQLTGKDLPVQQFLIHETKMPNFLNNIFAAVDLSIEDYLTRDFDALSISFGCTGGQHRSVFAAEQMKKHLKEIYNLDATLIHLEQEENTVKRR